MGDPTEEILNIESMEIGELTKAANAAAWLIPGFSQGYAAHARGSSRSPRRRGHMPIEGPEEREGLEPGTRWGPVIRRCSSCCMRL